MVIGSTEFQRANAAALAVMENNDGAPYTTREQLLAIANAYGELANEIEATALATIRQSAICAGVPDSVMRSIRKSTEILRLRERSIRSQAFTLPSGASR